MGSNFIGHKVFEIDPPKCKYRLEGGVPVFEPDMAEFADFAGFVKAIEKYGMETGIVKVLPPKEWLDALPKLDGLIKDIKIKNPIMQNVSGQGGLFRMQNIEKQKTYDIAQWRSVCEDPGHQPPSKRGEVRVSKKKVKKSIEGSEQETATAANSPAKKPSHWRQDMLDETFDYRFDHSEFTAERCADLEKSYWKSLTYSAAMYGADMPGSLFDDSVKDWNVPNLDNILNQLNIKIPGVNSAYLYCGMWKSTFAWHLEDMDLFSINYIHFGAPKQWYSISQKDHVKFYQLMAEMWPEEYKNCKEFLRHKTFHASPSILKQRGIEVNKVIHYQQEFILTFPFGYHSGFNYGYNVAESVNFATKSWIPYGKQSKKCMCIDDSVGIDVYQLERHLRGEYTDTEAEADDDMINGLPTPPSESLEPVKMKKKNKKSSKRKRESKSATTESESLKKAAKIKPKTEKPSNKVKCETFDDVNACALCLRNSEGELIPITGTSELANRSAHVFCARAIPGAIVSQDFKSVSLDSLSDDTKALRCLACRHRPGLCIKCVHPGCQRAFHATCAVGAGALIIPSPDTGTANHPQCICRFHRSKRTNTGGLDEDVLTRNWAFSLLPGDLAQCQLPSGLIFGGVVKENNISEETMIVEVIGRAQTEPIEVEWRYIRHPGRENWDAFLYGKMPELPVVEATPTGKVTGNSIMSNNSKAKGRAKLSKVNKALLEKFASTDIEDDQLHFSAITQNKGGTWFYAVLSQLYTDNAAWQQGENPQFHIYNPIASTELVDIYFD